MHTHTHTHTNTHTHTPCLTTWVRYMSAISSHAEGVDQPSMHSTAPASDDAPPSIIAVLYEERENQNGLANHLQFDITTTPVEDGFLSRLRFW